jgi:hypothetical protein
VLIRLVLTSSNLNVTFLLTYASILTICLFQSFKERLLLPIEATWWTAYAALFTVCSALF